MIKSLVFLGLAILLCGAQAQTPESITKAQDSLSTLYRVSGEGMGRASILRGVMNIDIYNRIADVRVAYNTLGLDTTNLDTLEATWKATFINDLATLENLTIEGLQQTALVNEDLTVNLDASLQLHLVSMIANLNAVDQAYQLASLHITQAFAEFEAELTTSMTGQTGQPVIDAFVAMQRGIDLVTLQHAVDDELTQVVDWRARQAIADVQAVISQLP
ncbi:hypothetical protein B566_EDAN016965 [Ephemera danica]|nr:hypothetical protein B566_EDAN016965 [Ephemera danica]